MALNARMSAADPRLYNPSRDVAHNFQAVVTEVATRLDQRRWPAIEFVRQLQQRHAGTALSDEELGQACSVLVEFVASATERPQESMYDLLDRVGWFQLPPAAQVTIMAYVGQITTGMFFAGVREATLDGQGPCSDVKDLVAAASRCADAMCLPAWLRRLLRLRQSWKGLWNAVRKPRGRR